MRSSSSSAAPSYASAFGMGALSGAAAKTATAPLERVRLVLQTSTSTTSSASSFARANFVEVLRAEGVLGLWRGNALGVARAVLTKGTLFATQDHLSAALGSDASAGALAGVCAHVPAYPLDLLRTRIAGAVGAEASITAALGEVLRSGGVLALYRGAPATAGGAIAYEGTRFGVFGALADGETSPAGAAAIGVAASSSPAPSATPTTRSAASSSGRSTAPATSPRFASCSPRAARRASTAGCRSTSPRWRPPPPSSSGPTTSSSGSTASTWAAAAAAEPWASAACNPCPA